MSVSLKRFCTLFLSVVLAGSGAPSLAQDATIVQPGETTASYQDWLMRCVAQADQNRACEVVQTLQIEGQGVVATISVGRATTDSPMLIVIQVPQGVWLPSDITLKIAEDSEPLLLEYRRCLQVCIAQATLDATVLDSMKAAVEAGSFTFQDGAQREVSLPISFSGFSAALDASIQP
ncbi:invasion associated locus B family protein [Devosia chinhatensis]|uniref:Invasion associated locus B family protein n=1 Tax=Devosia chinhatensis TaxID=429727 RepID=A0A0F5FET6_9HYPH|nr:invasion associated locus B family protein [Devosia chinhatensis]KKB07434.1 hypothetical protein VE26_11730 [Devosia chinhatensis]